MKYGDIGLPEAALAEECSEVIQIISKKIRFGGDWTDIPPDKSKSRLEDLNEEMKDLIYQYNRFLESQNMTLEVKILKRVVI